MHIAGRILDVNHMFTTHYHDDLEHTALTFLQDAIILQLKQSCMDTTKQCAHVKSQSSRRIMIHVME
jgi:hypothetical protein